MKILKNIIKALFFILLTTSIAVFVLIYVLGKSVSNNYKLKVSDKFTIDTKVPVTALLESQKYEACEKCAGDTYDVELKMFGVIPFTSTKVEIVDEMYVAVLGNPFGMKLYTDGVLVTKTGEVQTENGKENPSKKAGLKVGDYIKSVDGKEITSNEDLSELVIDSKGQEMKIIIVRKGNKKTIKLTPVLEKETGIYRAGIYVKDSSAGIGTLTFYSPTDNIICGLGHAICDDDTNEALSLDSGEIVGASVLSITKGEMGEPGELNGKFTGNTICNDLVNDQSGVYGHLCSKIEVSSLTKVALKQEVREGSAQILTTIEGEKPKLYSCKIEICNKTSETQNIIVTITDDLLLNKSGGIIQGMSGSPILQNGKLIGAVTHVFVDDPTSGYGIFAENMLETAQCMASENKLKKAS